MTIKFIKLPLEVIDHYWPQSAKLFEKCFGRREQAYTIDDVYDRVANGEMQLWCAFENKNMLGAVVTSVTAGSKARKLSVIELAGNKMKKWIKILDEELTSFAIINGCSSIEAITRRGFSKFIPSFQIQNDAILHIKRLK